MALRTVKIDNEAYQIDDAPFVVGEWAAAQARGGSYVQGLITRTATGVVTIKEEGVGNSGRRPHITVAVDRVYMRRPGKKEA